MRTIFLLILGFCWIPSRGQNISILPADAVNISAAAGDSIPPPLITDTLLNKGPMKLTFVQWRVSAPLSTKSYLQFALSYQTDDVYNGRKNSTVIPLITPQVSYIFNNGLEADVSVGYDIHNPSPQVNQYNMDLAYNFSPGNGNYNATVTASRFFYSDQSGSTRAEQKGSLDYYNSYDFGFLEPGLDMSWIYGDGQDYGATFSLQHEFDAENGRLSVTPNISMNAGTQNYYDSYYRHRKYRISKKDEKPVYEEVLVYGDVLNAGKFQILDYEITAPLSYTAGRLSFNLTPTYAMPVNPADILVTTSYKGKIIHTKLEKEKLSNSFFIQLGFTYNFK